MGSWSWRRRALVGAGVLAVLWVLTATYLLVDARSAMDDGAVALRSVRSRSDLRGLTGDATSRALARAEDRFDDGARRLDHPVLGPLRVLPVASRHLAASRRLAHAARDGTEVARDAIGDLDDLVARPHRSGTQRTALLRDLAAMARKADRRLDTVDPGSGHDLVGPLGAAVERLRADLADARLGARRTAAVSESLATVLDGPRPFLLLGSNNAEMRNGGGMFLSAATLHLDRGRMDLGEVSPAAEIVLPEGSVPARGDMASNWPWLEPGRDLRNLQLTADFPQSAELAAANWEATSVGEPVAGVLAVDVDGIRALLRVVGAVEVDGVRYQADTVREELLREQYRRFEGGRRDRRDQLGQVARAVFDRLERGRWDVDDLATELVDAVAGRHLLVWAGDDDVQRAFRDAGADGHLSERSLSVALLNRGAEKLDSWLSTTTEVSTTPAGRGRRRLTIRYRIVNDAPAEGPAYLVGPNLDGLAVGDHRGLVVANLPAGATDVTLRGARTFLDGGDGPTRVVGGELTLRRGQTANVTVTATLPAAVDRLVLEPSARIPRTEWVVEGRRYGRDRRRTVTFRP